MGSDGRVIDRLREVGENVFSDLPVAFAYVFGSTATGRAHARSDVDVAMFLDPVPADELGVSLEVADRLSRASRAGNIDVVVLNAAPLPLKGRAVKDRVVIFSRDEPAR